MHGCLPLGGYTEDVGIIVVASLCDDDDDNFTDEDIVMIEGDYYVVLTDKLAGCW